jgi:heme iron utilization protein
LSQSPITKDLDASEQTAIDHMNSDHADAIDVYAKAFTGAQGSGWMVVGIDPEGLDLASGDEMRRVFFPEPLADARDLRRVLVDLVAEGRRILAKANGEIC